MSSATDPKVILLRAPYAQRDEGIAGEAIKPGHLVAVNSDGEIIKHSVAAGWAAKRFANADFLQGKTIDDAYAADDKILLAHCQPGDQVYAWLSGGEAITLDDFLTSNGDGTLKLAGSSDVRIAFPLEVKDASDSNDVDERIRVQII